MNATLCNKVILAFLLSGCSTTYTIVEPSSRNPYTDAQLTRNISGEKVTVEFMDGKTAEARDFRLEYDSCSWTELRSGLSQAVRTRDIRKVVIRGHWLGALEGLGIGILAGLIPAVVSANTIKPRSGVDYEALNIGMTIGVSLGTVWGAIVGHSDEYEFAWFTRKSSSGTGREGQPVEKREEQSR